MEVVPETNKALATQPSVSNGELLFEALIVRCNAIVREGFGGIICHVYFFKQMIKIYTCTLKENFFHARV